MSFYDFARLQPFFSFAKRNLCEPEYSLNIIRTFKALALHIEDELTTIIIRNENKKNCSKITINNSFST